MKSGELATTTPAPKYNRLFPNPRWDQWSFLRFSKYCTLTYFPPRNRKKISV